jgi:hypothetical protein
MLSVIMLRVIMMSVIMLNIIMLNVILLSVIMQNVLALKTCTLGETVLTDYRELLHANTQLGTEKLDCIWLAPRHSA